MSQRQKPHWIREGGQGLPSYDHADREGKIWLFTCVDCGARFANPPCPISNCCRDTGDVVGPEIVVHRFWKSDYDAIRRHGVPADFVEDAEARNAGGRRE